MLESETLCFSLRKSAFEWVEARRQQVSFARALPGVESSTTGMEEAMRADRVEVSWDQTKSNWLVRIVTGEEVIRRHCKAPKDADEQTLRTVAKKTIQEEGYEPEVAEVSIRR